MPRSGYKVIFVPFDTRHALRSAGGYPHRLSQRRGEAYGRPVGVAIDAEGALLVADDVGNKIWRVVPSQ